MAEEGSGSREAAVGGEIGETHEGVLGASMPDEAVCRPARRCQHVGQGLRRKMMEVGGKLQGIPSVSEHPELQAAGIGHRQDQPAVRLDPASQLPQNGQRLRSEEHTSELQSLMRISYAVFCLKK